jgi:metaxin
MMHYRLQLTIWQAYLKFSFMIPASPEPYKHIQPVPSGKLQRWAMNNSKQAIEEPGDLRYEAYLSLLDHRIRRAWVR